jgi:hypothetical protein
MAFFASIIFGHDLDIISIAGSGYHSPSIGSIVVGFWGVLIRVIN